MELIPKNVDIGTFDADYRKAHQTQGRRQDACGAMGLIARGERRRKAWQTDLNVADRLKQCENKLK